MDLIKAVFLMVVGAAWTLEQQNGAGSLYDELFPPINPNCTQRLTDLLLLRQENKLSEVASAEQASTAALKEAVQLLTDIRNALILNPIPGGVVPISPTGSPILGSCPGNFVRIGATCLYLATDADLVWGTARQFCQDLGGDLATFRDANAFAEALRHTKNLALASAANVWIGGYDQIAEGNWIWITGEEMPKGTPFWGAIGFGREPRGGRGENCALMYGVDEFMIHDAPCAWKCKPLCQIGAA
ncbi:low affinity immunoglobulin epsilon Fc receptor-like [Penaeus japonicus]|uniref:low affinity immunoglobulin epsilon Fc receptor-like n=1 Tax=Penaeus japonicus TaxID=27405 RepID=UPI001C714BCE|nr:low affinity immunoglobulin epsilon Fc receptor-like [Penaeus japonicus]